MTRRAVHKRPATGWPGQQSPGDAAAGMAERRTRHPTVERSRVVPVW